MHFKYYLFTLSVCWCLVTDVTVIAYYLLSLKRVKLKSTLKQEKIHTVNELNTMKMCFSNTKMSYLQFT